VGLLCSRLEEQEEQSLIISSGFYPHCGFKIVLGLPAVPQINFGVSELEFLAFALAKTTLEGLEEVYHLL
jgi:hypothetical protein